MNTIFLHGIEGFRVHGSLNHVAIRLVQDDTSGHVEFLVSRGQKADSLAAEMEKAAAEIRRLNGVQSS